MGIFNSAPQADASESAEEVAFREAVIRQRLAKLRLTPSGALNAVTKELSGLRQQLAEWCRGHQTPPEPVVHIPQSHTDASGSIVDELDLTFIPGEGQKMPPPWPALPPIAAQDAHKRATWISERVTQLLVYLDNINISQQQQHMRRHRRSLVHQLQELATQAHSRTPLTPPHSATQANLQPATGTAAAAVVDTASHAS